MNKTQKELVDKIKSIFHESISHRDGTISVRRSYFYRSGSTIEKFAAAFKKSFPEVEIVSQHDNWAAWPNTS